jgi:tyrosyl-DNA phosphodiesterase 2
LHNADAGILGGDLNAIERFDRNLHTLNNLKDAYLETGQEEGSEAGMTWGQMAATSSRNRHGLTRMDKILYCGDIQLQGFETFGTDVQVTDEVDRQLLIEEEGLEEGWATDHLGVKAKFLLVP